MDLIKLASHLSTLITLVGVALSILKFLFHQFQERKKIEQQLRDEVIRLQSVLERHLEQ